MTNFYFPTTTFDREVLEKELLRFLLVRTAAVRCGGKPGELLRVNRVYTWQDSEGDVVRYSQRKVLSLLRLPYCVLRTDERGSLILFYHPQKLSATLRNGLHIRFLSRFGFPAEGELAQYLTILQKRFAEAYLPHEVGIFLGYPLKDVVGFIQNAPKVPVRGRWQVFGNPRESLRKMELYRSIEVCAETILETFYDIETCLEKITQINPAHWKETYSCRM